MNSVAGEAPSGMPGCLGPVVPGCADGRLPARVRDEFCQMSKGFRDFALYSSQILCVRHRVLRMIAAVTLGSSKQLPPAHRPKPRPGGALKLGDFNGDQAEAYGYVIASSTDRDPSSHGSVGLLQERPKTRPAKPSLVERSRPLAVTWCLRRSGNRQPGRIPRDRAPRRPLSGQSTPP